MSILYNRLSELCDEKGITGYRMCKDCKLSPSTMTDLKSGRKKTLSAESAERIAAYFGVTVAYLLGAEERTEATDDLAKYVELLMERPELRTLLEVGGDSPKADVLAMTDFMKNIRRNQIAD